MNNLSNSNPSEEAFFKKLTSLEETGIMPGVVQKHLMGFYDSYKSYLTKKQLNIDEHLNIFSTYLSMLEEILQQPHLFEPIHKKIISPTNYYKFAIDFFRPLIDYANSSVSSANTLNEIKDFLDKGHNVIFLANHQIEPDPQVISLLLEKEHPKIADELFFVAGEKVVVDPISIPFSLGTNLICIYSKRYLEHPIELREEKLLHNKRTMQMMSKLLSEGGHCIYVAPSGGRDRYNQNGELLPAELDPNSVEMFYLMSKRAKTPTHFYPLALYTYPILPPPKTIQKEIGEERQTRGGAAHLSFGPAIDMENFPGSDCKDKHLKRKKRSDHIYQLILKQYKTFPTSL